MIPDRLIKQYTQTHQLEHDKLVRYLCSVEDRLTSLEKRHLNKPIHEEIHPEFHFKLKNGQELKSLEDLHNALKEMSDDVYFHHVHHEKNDFAVWIKDVLNLHKLAEQVKLVKDKKHMISLIDLFIDSKKN